MSMINLFIVFCINSLLSGVMYDMNFKGVSVGFGVIAVFVVCIMCVKYIDYDK